MRNFFQQKYRGVQGRYAKARQNAKTVPVQKGEKHKKKREKGSRLPRAGAGGGVRFWRMRARRDCAQVRAQRSELVAALVLPVHCQLAISGRSTPCAAIYCRCSTSLSRICCTA